jgi:hypothetical protein
MPFVFLLLIGFEFRPVNKCMHFACLDGWHDSWDLGAGLVACRWCGRAVQVMDLRVHHPR